MFDFLADWTVTLMDALGAVGVGLSTLLETIFPPIPSELVLPMAGFASTQGEINAWAAIVGATIGSLMGAWLLYFLGAVIGADRLRAIADWMWLTDAEDVDKALHWFSRFGEASVLIGRIIPGVRSLISIPAGVHGMGLLRFSVLTTIGSAVWNSALIWLGVLLGENWTVVSDTMDRFSIVIYVVIAVAVLVFLAYLIHRDRKRKREAGSDQSPQD